MQALAAEIEPLVQETLHHDESDRFELDVYLGKDPAQRHPALAEQLFAKVRAPLLRALFAPRRRKLAPGRRAGHRRCRHSAAAPRLPAGRGRRRSRPSAARPSRSAQARAGRGWPSSGTRTNAQAVQRGSAAAVRARRRRWSDWRQSSSAPTRSSACPSSTRLFNRASPDVDGVIYEFVRRAESLGMPVVDDPESILKCAEQGVHARADEPASHRHSRAR